MPSSSIATRIFRGGLKAILPLVALAVAVSAFSYLKGSGPQPPKPKKRETVHLVRTEPVVIGSHQPTLQLFGETTPGRKVELRALVAGTVTSIGDNLREGAKVEKGERLLTVDDFSYKGAVIEAKANIAVARARLDELQAQIEAEDDTIKFADQQLKLSKRDLERAMRLIKRGSATEQAADQRKLTVSERRMALRNRRSSLAVLRAKRDQEKANIETLEWKLKQAGRNLKDTLLTAPFSGYVATVNANVGRLVNANDHVATLIDSEWIDVVFNLSDRQYGRISGGRDGLMGRKLSVRWHVGSEPQSYQAVVDRVAAQISSESGGVSVYARLKNPRAAGYASFIRSGAFVEVEMPDRRHDQVVRLPQAALYGRSRVYVVGPDNRLRERKVTSVGVDREHVLLRGDLKAGERVVTTRMSTIGGGLKVRDLSRNPPAGGGKGGKGRKRPEGSMVDKRGGNGKKGSEAEWQPTKGAPAKKGASGIRRGSSLSPQGAPVRQGGGAAVNNG